MKEGLGSGEKRRPYGCLIIKKKVGESMSSGGCGKSVVEKGKERKRRLILSDSESGEDDRGLLGSNNLISSGGGVDVGLMPVKREEESGIEVKRTRLEASGEEFGMRESRMGEVERKRGRMEVEFEEDRKFLKKEKLGGKGSNGFEYATPSGKYKEFESGHGRSVSGFRREHDDFDRRKSFLVEPKREVDYFEKQRMGMKESSFREQPRENKFRVPHGEPIRVQGKNGVLKVMVNRNKVGGSEKFYGHREVEENRNFSRSADSSNWKSRSPVVPSFYSEEKLREKSCSFLPEEKNRVSSFKSLSAKHYKDHGRRTESTSDMPLSQKLRPAGVKEKSHLSSLKKFPEKYNEARDEEAEINDMLQKSRSLVLGDKNNPDCLKKLSAKYSEARDAETEVSDVQQKSRSSVVEEKNHPSSLMKLSATYIDACDGETEISDVSLMLNSRNVATCSIKEVRKKEKSLIAPNLPSKRKEGAVRRGIGTEKQLLREQIRKMLLDAGWTIDLRPRRARNYQDAVYKSPSGTEYWSIVKAYNALQKIFEEDGEDSMKTSSFVPISEDVIGQLTRKTKRKIEREMKMKNKADGGSRNEKEASKKQGKNKHANMNSYGSQDGNSLKVRIKGNSSVCPNTDELDQTQRSTIPSERVSDEDGVSLLHGQGNSSDSLPRKMQKSTADKKLPFATDADFLQGRKNKNKRGRALLVRGSNNGLSLDDDDFVPYSGKRTVLSWLVDMETVRLSGKVRYMNKKRTQAMLEGWITRDGIHCGCCSKILTVSKFEIHAASKLRQPFQNIVVENGDSLLECQLKAWDKLEKYVRVGFYSIDVDGDDPNDDSCGICGDGGDLICCDGCPCTFHQSCLGIQMLPSGDWHCPNCSCKYCNGIDRSTGQGGDTIFTPLCTCSLCEEKYHQLCGSTSDSITDNSKSLCNAFCGGTCKELFQQLQKLLEIKHELEEGFSWTLIQRSDVNSDASIRALPQKAECNSKLAVAQTVMDECFLPVIDRRSGVNLIHNVVFNIGSNFNRLNYSGFYTAVLERGDEIVSAASIRIHGTRLAEMPYIATRHIYRRQGMCRRLLNAIESALCSLKVEKLVIPAIPELTNTWTTIFGFKPLEDSDRQELRHLNMLVFPSTDMLQKPLLKHNEGDVTSVSDAGAIEQKNNSLVIPVISNKTDTVSSVEMCVLVSDKGVHAKEMNNDSASVTTGLLGPGGSTCEASDVRDNPLGADPGLLSHALNEESPHDASFLHSVPECNSELEAGTKIISNPFVKPERSAENATNGAHVLNVVIEVDLQSPVKTSIQHMSKEKNEYHNAVSGNSFHCTNESPVERNSDVNVHKVESRQIEVCQAMSDAAPFKEDVTLTTDESAKLDGCKMKAEIPISRPDPCTFDECRADNCSNVNDPRQNVDFVNDFQVSDLNITSHVSEGTNRLISTVSVHNPQGSGETLLHHHDSGLLKEIGESAFDASDKVIGACQLEKDAAMVQKPQALGKDSVDCTPVNDGSGLLLKRGRLESEIGRACQDQAFTCREEEATRQDKHQ